MRREIFALGICLIFVSIFGMIVFHNFTISAPAFIIGIIIAGIAYTRLSDADKKLIGIPENPNTGQAAKNLQGLNDILWGTENNGQIPRCPVCNTILCKSPDLIKPVSGTRLYAIYYWMVCSKCGYHYLERK